MSENVSMDTDDGEKKAQTSKKAEKRTKKYVNRDTSLHSRKVNRKYEDANRYNDTCQTEICEWYASAQQEGVSLHKISQPPTPMMKGGVEQRH